MSTSQDNKDEIKTVNISMDERDLLNFGYMCYGDKKKGTGGNMVWILNGDLYRFEIMFMRKLLNGMGYKIFSEEDWGCDKHSDIKVTTDYPYERYSKLREKTG